MAGHPRSPRPGPDTDPDYPALKALIIARTGHHYYVDKDELLLDRLRRRFKACGLCDARAYLAHLANPESGPPEWTALEAEITIGETFFFRYAEQFAALRETILPGLIAARAQTRTLRIWSAGCSTGAEPYSIAVLLHDLLGDALTDWRITVTGTDINDTALSVARRGEYGRWAMRTLPPEDRQRLFLVGPPAPGVAREGRFILRPHFRRMVRFETQNLLALRDGGAPDFWDFDLILCRNVLIYFDIETVFGLVRSFGRRLAPDGWLLLGHAEPNPSFADILDAVNMPGTVAYRPRGAEPVMQQSMAPPPVAPAPWIPLPAPERAIPPAVPLASAIVASPPLSISALDRIRALADSGETAEAWRSVRAAILESPTEAALHYYDGLLAWSLGREDEAERALRGALYLDRDFVMAHYQLGLLLASLGRGPAAIRALDNAITSGSRLAADMALPEGDGARAAELVASATSARDSIEESVA